MCNYKKLKRKILKRYPSATMTHDMIGYKNMHVTLNRYAYEEKTGEKVYGQVRLLSDNLGTTTIALKDSRVFDYKSILKNYKKQIN